MITAKEGFLKDSTDESDVPELSVSSTLSVYLNRFWITILMALVCYWIGGVLFLSGGSIQCSTTERYGASSDVFIRIAIANPIDVLCFYSVLFFYFHFSSSFCLVFDFKWQLSWKHCWSLLLRLSVMPRSVQLLFNHKSVRPFKHTTHMCSICMELFSSFRWHRNRFVHITCFRSGSLNAHFSSFLSLAQCCYPSTAVPASSQ